MNDELEDQVDEDYEETDSRWYDQTVYEWSIVSSRWMFLPQYLILLSLALLVPFFCYAIFWALSLLSGTVAIWLSYVVMIPAILFWGFCLIGAVIDEDEFGRMIGRRFAYYVSLGLSGLLFFILASPASHFQSSFQAGNQASFGHWLLFYVDNFASAVLFDVPDVLDVHISPIRVDTWFSRILTLLLRVVFLLTFVEILFGLLRSKQAKQRFYGTHGEFYWNCDRIPHHGGLSYRKTASFDPLPPEEAIPVGPFITAFQPRAEAKDEKSLTAEEQKAESFNHWNWEDKTAYRWELTQVYEEDKGQSSSDGCGMALLPVLIFGFLYLIGIWFPKTAFWIAVVFGGGWGCIGLAATIQSWIRSGGARLKNVYERNKMAALVIGCLLYFLTSPMSGSSEGFTGTEDAGFWQWILFYLDNTAGILFFDLFDLFDFHMSSIRATGLGARWWTVLLRMCVLIGVASVVFRWIKGAKESEYFYGSVKELYWHCHASYMTEGITVQQLACGYVAIPEEELKPVRQFAREMRSGRNVIISFSDEEYDDEEWEDEDCEDEEWEDDEDEDNHE